MYIAKPKVNISICLLAQQFLGLVMSLNKNDQWNKEKIMKKIT